MAQLASGIGIEQRKHTSLRTKAGHYRRMAAAIIAQDTVTIATFPKYIPRGHPPEWYLSRADRFQQESETAGEMAHLLRDMEHRTRLDGMTAEETWLSLVGHHRWPGDNGQLDTIAFFVDILGETLPYLWHKLTAEQRLACQQLIRGKMEELIAAFDGRGPWTR